MPASEERSLHEFPSAMSILATTLLWVSTVSSGSTSRYDSEKTTAGDLALAILGDFEFTQDLATNVKTIFGAINELNTGKQNTIKYVTGSVTLEANSYVSPFTYYKEVDLTSTLANKTVIGIVGKTTTTNPITFNYNTNGNLRIYGSKADVVEFRISYI